MRVLKLLMALITMLICFLYMHFQVFGVPTRINDLLCVLAGSIFDISVILLFFSLVTWKRVKLGLSLASITVFLISVANVTYSRFFHSYLPLDSLSVVNDFGLIFYLNYIRDAFRVSDIIYLFLFIFQWNIIRNISSIAKPYYIGLLVSFIFLVVPNSLMMLLKSHSIWVLHRTNFPYEITFNPNQAISYNGFVTSNFYLYSIEDIDLSPETVERINNQFFDKSDLLQENHDFSFQQKKNVIFILVESYLSCVTDLVVDGKEVTPFLNSLKNQTDVYYNGNMVSNISIGESSDGQFIYLTGLLPLQDTYTTSIAKNNRFPTIPSKLKEKYGYKTLMTIPTDPNLWQQKRMCEAYGIDSLYCCYDYDKSCPILNDSTVFLLAEKHQISENIPFFDMILTLSMHSPYEEVFVPSLFYSEGYSREYQNYLSLCNYTDRQLCSYFEWTKENGLYENSIFIIAADHQAHNHFLKMGKESLNEERIPLFIVGPNSRLSENRATDINQIDLYPSLLWYFGIEGGWKGFGNNIFDSDSLDIKEADDWVISSQIIRSNFFEKYKDR